MPADTIAAPSFAPRAFALLEGLAETNEKAWYDAHKAEFEAELRAPFAQVLEAATAWLDGTIHPLVGSKKTMFRQNRDVRFSKDKSPYKTSVSGLMTPSGTKSEAAGVVYLHLDATGGFVAAGFHQFPTAKLGQIRDRIVDQPGRFQQTLDALAERGLDLDRGNGLTRMPKGYEDQSDGPHAEYLKLKSFLVMQPLDRAAWTEGDVVDRVTHHALACADFLGFCATALET
ncbi:MAG: DUF2461 domain-containing protein [Shimia sp.]